MGDDRRLFLNLLFHKMSKTIFSHGEGFFYVLINFTLYHKPLLVCHFDSSGVDNNLIPFKMPESYRRIHGRIKDAWIEGSVVLPEYVQQRMEERGIDDADLDYVIVHGQIESHEATSDDRTRYKITGRSVDGFRIKVVVEINGETVIVTTWYV